MMEQGKFDLLPDSDKNEFFRVSFDFFTPRPHFILLAKYNEDDTLSAEFSWLTTEQIDKMFLAATSMLFTSGIPSGILSIHRGSWISAKDKFHAHLCVNVEQYLSIFEQRKTGMASWPNSRYVTRKWRASTDPGSYALNVLGYPYADYFTKEVAVVEACRSMGEHLADHSCREYRNMTVVYHPSHPKVGFVNKDKRSARKVLEVMEKFAEKHGLTIEGDGCHLCLYLRAVDPVERAGWKLGPDVDIAGYIVTTGKRFYQLCPAEHRDSWFEAYRSSKFSCVT